MAGRIAEELIFGYEKVTTGASNDIQVATNIARNMVTRWGLSDKMGTILYEKDDQNPFGHGYANQETKHISDETALNIDHEVRYFIDNAI